MLTKTSQGLYMEDVVSISLKSFEVIEKELKKYGVVLTPEQEDKIYIPLSESLEELSNGDYRNYN